ncbi:MAG: papain-like cysteine protease family protein, partial [Bacteroidota bacterium]
MLRWFIFTLVIFLGSPAQGQSIRQLDSNRYWVGIPQVELNLAQARSVNGGKQLQSRWCWAACIQIIMNYHGLAVHQEDLVRYLYGFSWINRGADEDQMLAALNRWATSLPDQSIGILAKGGFHTPETLIKALAYKWPLIVGLSKQEDHHAVVITSIEYTVKGDGFLPISVGCFDPWPTAPTFRKLSWTEFEEQCT